MPVATAVTELSAKDRKLNSVLKRGIASIKRYGRRVAAVMKTAAVAVLGVGIAAVAGAALFLKAFASQEKAERRLEAVIKATGQAAGFTAGQMKEMASALQTLTGIGDEVILAGQAILATFKEIKGDEFKDATVAMLDMAAVLDTDLKSAAILVGKALNDPIKGATALSRSGVTFTEVQKDMIKTLQESGDMMGAQRVILDELESQFKGTAEALGNTFGGRVSELVGRLGDLGEQIGEALVPSITFLIEKVNLVTNFIEDNRESIKAWIKDWANLGTFAVEIVGGNLIKFMEIGIKVFTTLEGIFNNFKATAEFVGSTVALSFVILGNEIAHIFTEVIPANLLFLARVFKTTFVNIGSFLKTVLTNMLENVGNFFTVLLDKIRGKDVEFNFKALSDGFENEIPKMTDAAKRVPSALENALSKQAGEAGSILAEGIGSKLEERLGKFRGIVKGISEGLTTEQRKDEARKKFEGVTGGAGTDRAATKDTEKKQKAAFEGLQDMAKRIATAAAGGDPQTKAATKTAAATSETAKGMDKTAKATDQSAKTLTDIYNLLQMLQTQLPLVGAYGV